MLRLLNPRENPNAIIGIIFLLLLALFAGPNNLPRLIELLDRAVGFVDIDTGLPCSRLRVGADRGNHQSILARALAELEDAPISLEVSVGGLPPDPTGTLEIAVTVINNTMAPVSILVGDELIFNPGLPQSGLGVIFNGVPAVTNIPEGIGSYPEERIRVLGPRQRCVQRVAVVFGEIPNFSALTASNATVTAFYRNAVRGSVPLEEANQPFTDQGLWVGLVLSGEQLVNPE